MGPTGPDRQCETSHGTASVEKGSVRTRPPWNEGGPALRVGFDPERGEYIIRAPGGHIIGATAELEEVGRLIKYESDNGYGSVELLLSARHFDSTYRPQTHHGLRQRSATTGRGGGGRAAKLTSITLADLDLDI